MELFTTIGNGIITLLGDLAKKSGDGSRLHPVYPNEAYNPLRGNMHVAISTPINPENSSNRSQPIFKAKERLMPIDRGTMLDYMQSKEYIDKMDSLRAMASLHGPGNSGLFKLTPETRRPYRPSSTMTFLNGDTVSSRDRGKKVVVEDFPAFKGNNYEKAFNRRKGGSFIAK